MITGAPARPASAAYKYGNQGRIITMKLGGPAPPLPAPVSDAPLPEPPPRLTSKAQVADGEVLYNRYCARCHVFGRGILPDLRRMDPATHGIFNAIVLQGPMARKAWDGSTMC